MRKGKGTILLFFILLGSFSCCKEEYEKTVSLTTLLNEMTDLERLTVFDGDKYKTVQFSSYDRRSTGPEDSLWFANEDGFGGEPFPGFEKVIKSPDKDSIGEYLICDIKQPGVIQRLWTAGISGKIRLFLDSSKIPAYEGNAENFFRKTAWELSGRDPEFTEMDNFSQSDASYFPIPFSAACRMEWIGDIRKIHFYHVGLRLYRKGTAVSTFSRQELIDNASLIAGVNQILGNADTADIVKKGKFHSVTKEINAFTRNEIFRFSGPQAIRSLSVKISASDIESALRSSIISIYFDGSPTPQVQAPVGDFFGTAPGLNPCRSIGFTVRSDGDMECHFIMPFCRSAVVFIENLSDKGLSVKCRAVTEAHSWINGKTMHFRARWHMDSGITASCFGAPGNDLSDITYLIAVGKGRLVGTAAFIYNPSNAVTSWGNWWGEGDEKIYTDRDTFPSFFGTGTEDYFNYSWSSAGIFSFPYCGQTRNDGPGNRGYVSDYRLHIFDDIPFRDKMVFKMEIANHGIVKDFSYGRIVYFYGLPGILDDFNEISSYSTAGIYYKRWAPIAYLGSEGFKFIEAQDAVINIPAARVESDKMCSDNNILIWSPHSKGQTIRFLINSDRTDNNARIGFTLEHCPQGGSVAFSVNGKRIKVDGLDTLRLFLPFNEILSNHFLDAVTFKKGQNEISLCYTGSEEQRKIGIDFIWLRKDQSLR